MHIYKKNKKTKHNKTPDFGPYSSQSFTQGNLGAKKIASSRFQSQRNPSLCHLWPMFCIFLKTMF
jgi:hypothetical protein